MSDVVWKIIVVEDEYDSMQMVSEILKFHGIDVLVAHNGRECMQLLDHHQVDLVITDLAMPEMDGWETLQAIRANPRTRNMPVVALSAYHSVDVSQHAADVGFDAFFAKPVSPKTFVQNLARFITPNFAQS